MFCFCESNEKRLNSVRSKFADVSISRLIEDRGQVWSSTFLQAIQSTRDMGCIRDIDLEKVWNEVQKLKTFFFLFLFSTW